MTFQSPSRSISRLPLLVVEAVLPASVAAQAGLRPLDRLVSYDGRPLFSPASLLALEENTFGNERVVLQIQRDGSALEVSVPTGKLGVESRPELLPEVLAEYETGQKALEGGRPTEAAEHWRATAEQADEPEIAAWLHSKTGEAWEKASRWEQATGAHEAAWTCLQRSEDTAFQSQVATALGRCYQSRNEWDKAVEWYEQARRMEETEGREIWLAARMSKLGNVAYRRGDLELAQNFHTRALQIQERLAPDSLEIAKSLGNLGNVVKTRGNQQQAQNYYVCALQIFERLAPNSLEVAASLQSLGNVADDRGDLAAAQDFYVRTLQIRERLAPDSLEVAGSFNNLGHIAKTRGDLATALNYHLCALQIQERLAPGSLDVAISLNNLGIVYQKRGDLLQAQDYLLRALHIKERLAPGSLDVAISLNNLGNVAYMRGDLELAQNFHTRALLIKERFNPISLYVAASLDNLGELARILGDLHQAYDFLTRALQIRECLAPGSLKVANSLHNLGTLDKMRGDLAAAQDYHARALQIQERLAPDSLDTAECCRELGHILLTFHRPHDALPCLQQAVEIVEQQRAAIGTSDARALLVAQHLNKYASLIQCHLALHNLPDAFATLERARARSFLDMMAERPLDFSADAPAELLQQQRKLDQERKLAYDALARLSAADEADVESLHARLRDLQRRQQDLATRIRQTSPRYADLQYPQPLDLPAAQQALDPGTLALCYFVDDDQTLLFALTRTALQVVSLPLGRQALQQQVNAFREALDVRLLDYSYSQALRQGKHLYDLLLAPVRRQIRASQRLLLCPDAALHMLPFAALVPRMGRRARYLGEEKPLHTTLSLTVYARSAGTAKEAASGESRPTRKTALTRRLLALGDPLYVRGASAAVAATRSGRGTEAGSLPNTTLPTTGSELAALQTRGLTLQPLPHTRIEVQVIGRLFGRRATIRVGRQATKTAAMAAMAQADLLHFACHGWLDAQSPLASGLILSQPQALGKRAPEGDTGLLQAWEIFEGVKLSAELVTLSACQTGLGAQVQGEGVIGLTRAFGYAGARSVLVSLWEVNDASTSELMQAFYAGLQAGESKAEALQRAMAGARANPRWDHPFFWAAFTLHGEWR